MTADVDFSFLEYVPQWVVCENPDESTDTPTVDPDGLRSVLNHDRASCLESNT
jgi:hypothetical protein